MRSSEKKDRNPADPDRKSENSVEIEDPPYPIPFRRYFEWIKKKFWIGCTWILVCAGVMGLRSPASSSTNYEAQSTLFIPSTFAERVGNRRYIISNNLSQIPNMIGLIQTKLYRDQVYEILKDKDPEAEGSFYVFQTQGTELLTISAYAFSEEAARLLCESVAEVLLEQVGPEVSINGIMTVDSVHVLKHQTVVTMMDGMIKGAEFGILSFLVVCCLSAGKNPHFSSKEEVEGDLEIPVLAVIPDRET